MSGRKKIWTKVVEGRTFHMKEYGTVTWPWFAYAWNIRGQDYVTPPTATFSRDGAWDLAIRLYEDTYFYIRKGSNITIPAPWKGKWIGVEKKGKHFYYRHDILNSKANQPYSRKNAIRFLKRRGGRVIMMKVKVLNGVKI